MDPSSNESFGMQLPTPVETAQPAASKEQVEAGPAPAESAPASPEQSVQAPTNAAPAAMAPPPVMPLPLPPTPLPAGQASATKAGPVVAALPVDADDGDLIEKEWVHKAKAIIESTRDDPYRQSEELTAVKADYMQKRYNKTIKVSK